MLLKTFEQKLLALATQQRNKMEDSRVLGSAQDCSLILGRGLCGDGGTDGQRMRDPLLGKTRHCL